MRRLAERILFFVAVMAAATAVYGQGPTIVGKTGEVNIGPIRTFVHVSVVVPPGRDANAIADEALRGQAARPLQSAEFVYTGLVWNNVLDNDPLNDEVVQLYNGEGAPSGFNAAAAIQAARDTWTDVTESVFAFDSYGAAMGTTGTCPSLVKECPGKQDYDGENGIGFVSIKGCCTLAVTWYSTSIDEADVAFNTRFNWTDTTSNYNLQTVALHELGHVLGLDHSTVSGSVMRAAYAGYDIDLGVDDERAASYLYPNLSYVGTISGTVIDSGGDPIGGATVSIADFPASTSETSAADGTFTFEGIPNIGAYSVTATKDGYDSDTETNVLVDGADVILELSIDTGGGGGGGGGPCNGHNPLCQ